MLNQLITPITFIAILGCGISAGIFYAFSYFVMEATGKLPTPQGIAAMQSINIVIVNPLFLLVFMGTAVLSIVLGGIALFDLQNAGALWRLAGALLFIITVIIVTIAFNIPLNNALDQVDPASLEGTKLWERYLSVWTRWNHVRTLASIAATAFFILALQA